MTRSRRLKSARHLPILQLAALSALIIGLVVTLVITKNKQDLSALAMDSCIEGAWKCSGYQALRCYHNQWYFQFGCQNTLTCRLTGSVPHCFSQ